MSRNIQEIGFMLLALMSKSPLGGLEISNCDLTVCNLTVDNYSRECTLGKKPESSLSWQLECFKVVNLAEMSVSKMDRDVLNVRELEKEIRQAIEGQQFCLHYQPIIDLETGKLRGFEALVRWQNPQHGLVEPQAFIPFAEETGLIHPLGWWILETACTQLHKWQNLLPEQDLFLNVNLSPRQLQHPNLVPQIKNLLQRLKLKRGSLKLELTESSFFADNCFYLEQLSQLQNLGVGLCIDDFGTGYSSLSRLHELPIDTIKLDRSFVQNLDKNERTKAIIKTIITLAQILNLNLVAEGIETLKQLESVKSLGCSLAQGYFFAKPLAVENAQKWVLDS